MRLDIESERTLALIRELAERTRMSQIGALEDAVRRRLEELGAPPPRVARFSDDVLARKRAAVRRIVKGFRADTTLEQRRTMVDHSWLYDDRGLPAQSAARHRAAGLLR